MSRAPMGIVGQLSSRCPVLCGEICFANCRARGEPAEGLADLVPSALTGTFAPNTVSGSLVEVIANRGPGSPLTNACSASVWRARSV